MTFEEEFPSIKFVHRVTVDQGCFKADDNVISKADVNNHCKDNQRIKEAIEKVVMQGAEGQIDIHYIKDNLYKELKLKES